MAIKNKSSQQPPYPSFRFNFEELSGAVGDYSTLLPIVVGAAVVSDLNLGAILLFFSLWYIITGLYYKCPVPVEPMKVVGAVVIAEGLGQAEIAVSGLVLGIIFLILGYSQVFKKLLALIPKAVVRGIQLGLSLLLIKTSFTFIGTDIGWAVLGTLLMLGIHQLKKKRSWPDFSALALLGLGIVAACFKVGLPQLEWPSFPGIIIPGPAELWNGTWRLVIPQFPLTITNAILATSVLFTDLLHKKIDPDRLSKSIGWMNITVFPFGGFPMCHGSGGLAAQYRYGARTGMSNIISGIILIPIALFLAQPKFIQAMPTGLFGVLLVFIAIELGKHALKSKSMGITVGMGIITLVGNVTLGFVFGLLISFWKSKRT